MPLAPGRARVGQVSDVLCMFFFQRLHLYNASLYSDM